MKADATTEDVKLKEQSPATATQEPESFAETALKLGGKSDEETRRIGALDRADEQVESLFKYSTAASPAHRAVWDRGVPTELFNFERPAKTAEFEKVASASKDVVRRHRAAGTLYNEDKKIAKEVLVDLGEAGYWGLLIPREYGGTGAPFAHFAPFLSDMATLEGTIAGLASVHGCIGAVDPICAFGNEQQKKKYLPLLASGERLSAFALTEPCAGSDLTALRTTAELQGDDYVVNGEKLFITNAVHGATIGLVCKIDNRPAVLIADLPDQDTDEFQFRHYELYAIRGAYNRGMIFKNFRVPAENLLQPKKGDGLTIAYHGLNRGRVSLCANASGTMKLMMASMIPWAKFRVTYGQKIGSRELVRRRLGSCAGLVVACDALVDWCSGLLDQGYRGEMECTIAKIFGSESQKHAAIEYFMKTHGGRSFLGGHTFGDNVHEYLAPCIYEGEGEMLGMAFFKSLVKEHGKRFFEPIGMALMQAGIRKPNMANPAHMWALKGPFFDYGKWMASQRMRSVPKPSLPPMPSSLREHAEFAADFLQRSPLDISGTMRKHQLTLPDRQCRMAEVSQRIQDALVILCTALHGSRSQDELVRDAADVACQELTRRLTGTRPSDRYFRTAAKLGEAIAEGGYQQIAGISADEILMPYEKK